MVKSLADQIAELQDPAPPPELDPESHDVFAGTASDSDAGDDANEFDGREHYEAVGEGKLRKPAQPVLGKRYAGATVSRNALDEESSGDSLDEDDDENNSASDGEVADEHLDIGGEGQSASLDELEDEPLEANGDSEIDSDEAFGSSDEDRFKGYIFRGSRETRLDGSRLHSKRGDDMSAAGSQSEDLEENMDDLDMDDEDSEQESDEDSDLAMDDDSEEDGVEDEEDDDTDVTLDDSEIDSKKPTSSSDRAVLRALMSSDTKTVAATISAAASSDAQKGRAVREQYQTFDKLIDLRIKLQKGVVATNSLTAELSSDTEAVQRAEKAALQLWSTLESLRHDFLDAQDKISPASNPRKRKRPAPATQETPSTDLWSRSTSLEEASLPHRRTVLNRWSAKVRASTATAEPRSKLLGNDTKSAGITSIIDSYLTTQSDKLIDESTSTPSSSSSTTTNKPLHPYDDSIFYQSLLRDLINSRSTTTQSTNPNLTATILLPSTSALPKKHRANVDQKASKGRKVRYTVHEKLMNFTASEGLSGGRWGEAQKDEFFGSLFGGRKVLEERDENENEVEDGEGEGQYGDGVSGTGDAEALRLFR